MRAKFINEKFTEDSDPIKDMGIGLPELNDEYLFDLINKNFEEAEQYAITQEINAQQPFSHKDWDRAFNNYIRTKDPRLAHDVTNFYKWYNRFGPQ